MRRGIRLCVVAATLTVLPVAFGAVVASQSEAPLDPMRTSVWTGAWTAGGDGESASTCSQEDDSLGACREVEVITAGATATVEASDPRISGSWTGNEHLRVFAEGGGPLVHVTSWSVRIDNSLGAWVGTSTHYYAEDDAGIAHADELTVLRGLGAYEGLSAVFRYHDDDTLEGVIWPGDVPALPDPVEPTAE